MATNGQVPEFRKVPEFSECDEFFSLRTVAVEAPHIIPYIKTDSRIIDVGCGIGAITFDLARRAPEGYVLGVDYSAESIRIAKERAQALGISNIEFIEGDATDLPASIPSDSFDISHSHQLLIHLTGDGPVNAIKSIRRVVKPGGIVATRDNAARYIFPSTPALDRHMGLFESLARERGAYPDAGRRNHVWFHEAGFPWDNILVGDAVKSCNETAELKKYARTFRISFSTTFGKQTDEEEEWKQYLEDLKAWQDKPEARTAWFDGWVIGTK